VTGAATGAAGRARMPALALLALLLTALIPGCVSRRMFLVTDPPGARVTIDGRVVGTSPLEADFLSYGTRRVELELPGHERLVGELDIDLPWWQFFPMGLVTDLLVPWTIEDERHFAFTLRPVHPEEGTWADARAAQLRMREMDQRLPAMDGED
jgi:hypothetical protein